MYGTKVMQCFDKKQTTLKKMKNKLSAAISKGISPKAFLSSGGPVMYKRCRVYGRQAFC
jgi:hypothetical protein